MATTLSKILAPITLKEFRELYYTKRSILIRSEGKKFDWLFGWSSLNQIMNKSFFPLPTMKLVLDGKPINDLSEQSKIIDWCRKGATVIIDQLQNYDSQVRRAVDSLSKEIGEPVNANLYFSQPERQAFNVHYDHHDVIILQIEGHKRWKVYEDSEDTKFPLFVQKSHSSDIPDSPVLDCLLSSGDVLYIPRGHWHAATAKDDQSLHLTIGIDARTGIDFATWLTNELRDDVSFRQSFPLVFSHEIHEKQYYHELHLQHFNGLKQKLIHKLNDNQLFDHYTRYCVSKSQVFEPFYLPYSTDKNRINFPNTSSFVRYNNQQFLLNLDDDKLMINLIIYGKIHRFSSKAERLLEFIFSHNEFSLQDSLQVSDISEDDVAAILEHLLSEALIKFA